MRVPTTFFSTIARCLLFSIATADLGLTWGCGGGMTSQATLDDAGKAQIKEANNFQMKLREKRAAKAPKGKSGRLSKADLEGTRGR